MKAKRPGFTDERYNETSYYHDCSKYQFVYITIYKSVAVCLQRIIQILQMGLVSNFPNEKEYLPIANAKKISDANWFHEKLQIFNQTNFETFHLNSAVFDSYIIDFT